MQIKISNKNEYFTVDDKDCPLVSQFRWHLEKSGYLRGFVYGNGKPEYLHRFLLKPPKGMVTDHINGNKLDNRRENLRLCTQRQNTWNQRGKKSSKCGVKGVCYMGYGKRQKRWKMEIKAGETTITRFFPTKEEASEAYKLFARQLHGEFARSNHGQI